MEWMTGECRECTFTALLTHNPTIYCIMIIYLECYLKKYNTFVLKTRLCCFTLSILIQDVKIQTVKPKKECVLCLLRIMGY